MLFSVKGPLETYYALHALNACVLYDSMVLPMANRSSALKFCVLEIRPSSGYYIQNPLAIPLIFWRTHIRYFTNKQYSVRLQAFVWRIYVLVIARIHNNNNNLVM